MKRRKESGRKYVTPHCFSGRIYYDACGGLYGSKSWHSKTVWQCNAKCKGLTNYITPPIRNETMQDAFVRAFIQIVDRKDEIIQICEIVLDERCNMKGLTAEYSSLQAELDGATSLMQRLISENAHAPLQSYLAMLRGPRPIRTINETLWCGVVEQVRINENGTMRFIFKDGAVMKG